MRVKAPPKTFPDAMLPDEHEIAWRLPPQEAVINEMNETDFLNFTAVNPMETMDTMGCMDTLLDCFGTVWTKVLKTRNQ